MTQLLDAPTNLDILCGRGRAYFNYDGNVRFRMIIRSHMDSYKSCRSRTDKTVFIRKITRDLLQNGSRFLKRMSKNQATEEPLWSVMNFKYGAEKVGHALRNACNDKLHGKTEKRYFRRRSIQSENSEDDSICSGNSGLRKDLSTMSEHLSSSACNRWASFVFPPEDTPKLATEDGYHVFSKLPRNSTSPTIGDSMGHFETSKVINPFSIDAKDDKVQTFHDVVLSDLAFSADKEASDQPRLLESLNNFDAVQAGGGDSQVGTTNPADVEFARMMRHILEDVMCS